MNTTLFTTAFLLGAGAIVWMATGFIGSDPLALTVTVVIGCVYAMGIAELLQFRRATTSLDQALDHTAGADENLDKWIARLDPSLHNATRLRIEGERTGLPAPVFTPYLVGLLVMLGLLGTFVGMVETLQGAVVALQGSTELEAIRNGLAAPIEGLGLAFGTSVAGVAASAMLGLNSTVCRRERMLATRRLDSAIGLVFREQSLHYNRQETFKAMQQQARALPEVAQQLASVARYLESMGERLAESLTANQAQFFEATGEQYRELALSVDKSLLSSLAESARLAGESIMPVVATAMNEINTGASATREQLAGAVEDQLLGIAARLDHSTGQVSAALQQALQGQGQTNDTLVAGIDATFRAVSDKFESMNTTLLASMSGVADQLAADATLRSGELLGEISALLASSEELVAVRIAAEQDWANGQAGRVAQFTGTIGEALESLRLAEESRGAAAVDRLEQFTATLRESMDALRVAEETRGSAAVERLARLEEHVATHLSTLGRELEAPMTRLIETASETPRAAAEVIGKLREEVSNNIERDNGLLEERRQVMEQLNHMATSLEKNSGDQQQVVAQLVSSSAELMRDMGASLGDRVGGEVAKVADVAAGVAGSAHELAALGEAFSSSVNLFGQSNDKLIGSLERIEQSLGNASSRSDEQMSYYVAQAREIIDQSMLSQREIIDELRRLGSTEDLFTPAAG